MTPYISVTYYLIIGIFALSLLLNVCLACVKWHEGLSGAGAPQMLAEVKGSSPSGSQFSSLVSFACKMKH